MCAEPAEDPRPALGFPAGGARRFRVWAAYALMVAVTIGAFALIRERGLRLTAPPGPPPQATPVRPEVPHVLAHVLLALSLITLAARGLGALFQRYLRQPRVIGEIVAGLLLGPSLLGAVAPGAYAFLLPEAISPLLGLVSRFGVVLFMFLIGLELDPRLLRHGSHAILAVSHASILLPFVLGSWLALAVYPLYSQRGVDFTVFALFLGVSLSVTAFPVLARILADRNMQSTPLGIIAISCAAVDDATAWCLLALASGVARANPGEAGWTLLLAAVHAGSLVALARPLLRRLAQRVEGGGEKVSPGVQALVLSGALLSAAVTELIGIHALFGAFLFGAVMPHEGKLALHLRRRLHGAVALLLPVFFTVSGIRTHIGLLSTPRDWMFCGVIVAVATAGKLGGSFVAAWIAGLGQRQALALGVLMNTRGLMELIVLNVGLDMGVLSPTLFAMLVIMALVTTFSTAPVLGLLSRADSPAREI